MDQTPDAARWKPSGPDSDQPPWAGGQTDEPDRDEDPTDAEATGADEDQPQESAPDGAPPHTAGHAAGGPGAQLEHVQQMPRPPMPPRRTGVFLDPDDLREHVGGLLRVMLGGYQVDAWGNYTFTHEGARIFVTTSPSQIGPQVGVFSITNLDLDLTPQLAAFLVTNNHRMGFGSFSYDPDTQSVWLRHTLLGTTLDGPELQAAVMAVATTAAHVDDVIRDRFGGRAFHDAPEDVQSKARPPEPEGPPGRGDRPPNASGYL